MKKYLNYLDSIRGIAALFIVVLHFSHYLYPAVNTFLIKWTSIIDKAYLFVDLFFVLSGFVLSYKYMSSFTKISKTQYVNFIQKRWIRIYPLHFLTLIFIGALFLFESLNPAHTTDHFQILHNKITFLSNLFLLHSSGLFDQGCYNCTSWNYPSWSVSVEFLSYLIIPMIFFYVLKFKQVLFLLFFALIGFLFLINIEIGHLDVASWQGWLRCLAGIMVGILIYHFRLYELKIHFIWSQMTLLFIFISMHFNLLDFFIVSLIYLYFALTMASGNKLYLNNSTLQKLGKISYSIYMLHGCIHFSMSYALRSLYKSPLEDIEVLDQFGWFLFSLLIVIFLSGYSYKYIEVKFSKYLLSKIKK